MMGFRRKYEPPVESKAGPVKMWVKPALQYKPFSNDLHDILYRQTLEKS